MKKRLILNILIYLTVSAFGQNFLHLTSFDGLPDNHARLIYQDSSGYIYVGTRNGICRYDGYVFTIASNQDSASVPPRGFTAMIQASSKYFTIAPTGIYEYDRYTNSLKLNRRLQVQDEACFTVFKGTIYCGNTSGLFIYDPEENQWIENSKYTSGIDAIHIRSMLVTRSDELLIGTNKGFFRYNEHMDLIDSDLGNDPDYHDINCIRQDPSGNIWISTFTNVYKLDTAFHRTADFCEQFRNKLIRCLEVDPKQRIWVGGEFGIVIINPLSYETMSVHRDVGNELGLNDNAVYTIFRDVSDNMLVGTYFGGINLWNSEFDKFEIIHPGKGENNTSGEIVREMQEDEQGNLWLALEDGGLNYLNTRIGQVTKFFIWSENQYKNVHSIILEDDLIWLGSFNSGIECYRIRFRNGRPELDLVSSYIPDQVVFAIDRGMNGNLYAGSIGQLYVLDRKSGTIRPMLEPALNLLYIYTLKSVSEDELLLGTLRNGLYHYNTRNNIATAFSNHSDYSGMQAISYIAAVDSTNYLITCSNGLYRYNQTQRSLTMILKNQPHSEFRSILPDPVSGFWIGTTNGLLYADPSRSVSKKYNRYDGLPENQFNFNSAFKSRDGKYYFGTYNGLISFYPEDLKQKHVEIPEVSFTEYKVVGSDKTTLESFFLDNTFSEIRLKPYQTFLSIDFTTLGYSRTKSVDYQFRLANEGMNWDELMKARSITLTNLSKGWHRLEVRAVVDGQVSSQTTTISIHRQPVIWNTVYAYIFYTVILVIGFLLVRREYLRKQKARNALALERFEKENQKNLNEQKMQFFLNLSHEFRTPLSIIGGTITNILNKFNTANELKQKLGIIQNTSENLNKLVDDFLEYGKLDAGFKPLDLKKGTVMLFIRKACDMFDNWAEVNQLSYSKNIEDNGEVGFFDPFKLERVLYNLLSNAFKFTKTRGEVIVSSKITRENNTWLIISVQDNGPGINEETLNKLNRKFNQADSPAIHDKGIGLTYTAGLVYQLKGRIGVESKPGKGSVFRVKLPILLTESGHNGVMTAIEPSMDTPESPDGFEPQKLIRKANRPDILVIDDNSELLGMLSDSLSPDYHVMLFNSPLKALEVIKQKDFDLIICDIMMPEMNGIDVIDKIHSDIMTSHFPILVMTAAAEKYVELKGYESGAVSYLAKPFKIEELKIKIKSILSFRRELIKRYGSSEELTVEEITHTARDEQFLKKAYEVVNANIENIDFDVDQFCSNMNMSRTLLHTKLKYITGHSTTEFIRTIRLRKAYVYLKKGDYTVSEVAYKCGFKDPNYFSKCFTKMYREFPSKVKV
ncbi:MAG: hypothetical protein AMS26_00870 [Bacteroides sp. SM23_62]|nr:MAG: hypothetical protein AMS26_00870 [Bacteroides sp. SM23_62]